MDFFHLCRLCLKSSNYHSDIFTEIISNKHLYQLINSICELRVYRSDGLPEHICVDCFRSIKRIFSFKSRAKETEIALIRMMKRNCYMDSQREYVDAQDNTITEKETETGDLLEVIIKTEIDADEMVIPNEKEESASLMDFTEKEIISPYKERSESQEILIKEKEAEEEVEDNEVIVDSTFDHSTVNQIFIKEELIDLTGNLQEDHKWSKDDEELTESQFVNIRRLECHHCGEKRDTKQDIAQHIEDTHDSIFNEDNTTNQELRGDKKHICSMCEKRFNHKSSLERHMRKHTGEKPLQCDMCERKFNCKSKLKGHMLLHTGEKPFRCNICTFSCTRKGNLKDHMFVHTGEKPFHCNVCSFRCSRRVHLKVHMQRHMGEKPFHCSVCTFSSSTNGDLKLHMRIHTGEKPFKCDVCNYRCSQSGTLRVHMRKHTGEKPFQCNICGFSSSRSGNLKIHMRKHTGEKPFSCNVCTYSSSSSSGLIAHMRKHSGGKPFQ